MSMNTGAAMIDWPEYRPGLFPILAVVGRVFAEARGPVARYPPRIRQTPEARIVVEKQAGLVTGNVPMLLQYLTPFKSGTVPALAGNPCRAELCAYLPWRRTVGWEIAANRDER